MSSRRPAAWIAFAIAVLSPAWSHAANICWIDRVKRTATGVEIYFSSDRTVTVSASAGTKQRVFQTYSARTTTVYQRPGVDVVEAVPAALGDRLFAANNPHDNCSLVVALREGRIGLEVSAAMAMPGLPPSTAEKFIAAE